MNSIVTALSVFGLQLGAPLNLPRCDFSGPPVPRTQTCFDSSPAQIYFSAADQPIFVDGALTPLLKDGLLMAVTFRTRGASDQDLVLAKLKEKFGAPTVLDHTAKETLMGVHFDSISAVWSKPAYFVGFFGTVGDITRGQVEIATKDGMALLDSRVGSGRPL